MNRALTIQGAVLWALLLRETRTRFGRNRLGYLWAVLGPLAMVAMLATIFELIGRLAPAGLDFPVFLITGIVPWYLYSQSVNRVMRAVEGNRPLLVYGRVKPLDLVAARGLLEAVTHLLVLVLLLALAAALGYQGWPDQPLAVLTTFLCVALLGSGIGAVAGVAQTVTPTTERVMPLLTRPLYFTSGIFFSVDLVPEPYRAWLLLNPLLHANELMRAGFFAPYDGRHADPAYLAAWVAGAVVAGLLLHRAFRRWVTVTA